MKFTNLACGVIAALNLTGADALVKPMDHDIVNITPQSFDGAVRKNRDNGVSAVLFYKKDPKAKAMIDGWYNDVAKDLRGMVRIGAVNCDEFPVFCKEHNTKGSYPTIMAYPPLPIPVTPYEGKLEKGPLSGYLTRFIPNDNVKVMTAATIDEFLTNRPEIPKVLLFTTKEKAPTVYNALSNAFFKEMHFGFVPATEESLAKRFNVAANKKPQLVLIRNTIKKHERFTDKITYESVHAWLNLYRETFISGGGFEHTGPVGEAVEASPKPWLSDPLPELFKPSADNLCFKKEDKALCVVYVSEGPIDPVTRNQLLGLKERFDSQGDRGATFKFMWLNAQEEPAVAALLSGGKQGVAVINANKRLRFMKAESADTKDITNALDKIAGGDARFTNIKEFPAFAKREVERPQKKDANVRDEL